MKSRKRSQHNHSNHFSDPQLEELNGLCELGLSNEATTLAVTVLARRPLKQLQFAEAVDALLSHAEDLVAHVPLVVRAYDSMSVANRKACRRLMFHCHHAIGDEAAALPFVVTRVTSRTDSFDIACSIDVLLACKQMEAAESLVARSFHRVMGNPDVHDDHEAALINAVSSFFYALQRWEYALVGWQKLLPNTIIGPTAAVDITHTYIQMASQAAEQGLERIAEMRKTAHDPLQMVLPNVQSNIYADAEADLRPLAKALAAIVKSLGHS